MTCNAIRELLLDLATDEAGRRRIAAALAHLDRCEACRAAVGDYDRLLAALRTGGRSDADAGRHGADDDDDARDANERDDDATPVGGWDAFDRRLAAAASAGARPAEPRPAGGGGGTHGRRWLPVVGGLAASLALAWVSFRVGRHAAVGSTPADAVVPSAWTPAASPARPDAPPVVRVAPVLDPSEVACNARAFQEVDHVFEGRADWMLMSSSASDMGLADRPAGPQGGGPDRRILQVKLRASRGGVVVSDADLVIVPGATANVTVPTTNGGASLRYRVATSADDPTRIFVRVEVDDDVPSGGGDGAVMAMLGANLTLEPYRGASAGTLVTPAGAYDLTLSAAPSALPSDEL